MLKKLFRIPLFLVVALSVSAAAQDIGSDAGWVDPGMNWEEFQQTGFWQYEYDSSIYGCYNFCLDGARERASLCEYDPKNQGMNNACADTALSYYHSCNSWCQS